MRAIRGGAIPFWLVFNGENSLHSAADYLKDRAYRRVLLTLFSNYVPSPGTPEAETWVEELGAQLVGVDAEHYPFDSSSPIEYYYDLRDKLPARCDLPAPLTLEEMDTWLV